jgi:hypothetical protein
MPPGTSLLSFRKEFRFRMGDVYKEGPSWADVELNTTLLHRLSEFRGAHNLTLQKTMRGWTTPESLPHQGFELLVRLFFSSLKKIFQGPPIKQASVTVLKIYITPFT